MTPGADMLSNRYPLNINTEPLQRGRCIHRGGKN